MEFRLHDDPDKKKKKFSLDGLGRNVLCLFLGSPEFSFSFFFFFFFFFVFFLFCFATVVLFDNKEVSKCLNTLFLLSPHLFFIISFICDLSVSRNDSWMC